VNCEPPPCEGEGCEPPPVEGTPCSPGYWKNHRSEWEGIYCDNSSYTVSCESILDALTCRGSDADCGRSLAAGYLNSLTGCTED
jgi:hypothetical protein